MDAMTERALQRVLEVAKTETAAGSICADFLLALWSSAAHGGFDPSSMIGLPSQPRHDIATIIAHLAFAPTPYQPDDREQDLRELASRRFAFPEVSGPAEADGEVVYLP